MLDLKSTINSTKDKDKELLEAEDEIKSEAEAEIKAQADMFPLLFSFSFFCFQLMSSVQSKAKSCMVTPSNKIEFPPLYPTSAWESDKRLSAIQKNRVAQCQENQQLPKQKDSMDLTVSVHFETKGDGEHVIKIKGFNPSSTKEDNVERAKQMAHQKAAVWLLYGEMLQEMGKKWRAQSQA